LTAPYQVCSNNLKQSSLNLYSSAVHIHSMTNLFCYCTERIHNNIQKRQVSAYVKIMFTMFEFNWQRKQIERSRHHHYDTFLATRCSITQNNKKIWANAHKMPIVVPVCKLSIYLQPFRRSSFLECTQQPKIAKISKNPLFRKFRVFQSHRCWYDWKAHHCCDRQHAHACLQPFSWKTGQQR